MMLKTIPVTLIVTVAISLATCLSPRFRARRQSEDPFNQDPFFGNDVSQFSLHNHDQDPSQSFHQDQGFEEQFSTPLEEQGISSSRQLPGDDFAINGFGSFEETFANGQDAEEDVNLISLADHLDKEHFSPDTFRPSVRSCTPCLC